MLDGLVMNECYFPGCGRPVEVVKRGLCYVHSEQERMGLDLSPLQKYKRRRPYGMDLGQLVDYFIDRAIPTKSPKYAKGKCWVLPEEICFRGEWGYPEAGFEGRVWSVPRLVLRYILGDNFDADKVTRHKCDTPACIRPDHLEPGTVADNARDMKNRKRGKWNLEQKYGHYSTNMTPSKVQDMRDLYATGNYTQKELAEMYGMTQGNAGKIIRGDNFG